MSKPKIGWLTTFYNFDPAYSLVSVVRDQLVAHVMAGYAPVLFVLPSFEGDVPEGVEVRKVIPQLTLERYAGLSYPENWLEEGQLVAGALREHAADIDVMVCHDIFFIDTYLPYNVGVRESGLKCRLLLWTHSAPSPRPSIEGNPHANRYNLPPNAKLVYLNHDKDVALAEMYGAWPKDVAVVPNSRDPRTFWDLHPLVSEMVTKHKLLECDVLSVYPVSSTRMVDGKQIDVVIRIHEQLRKLGLSAKLVVPNAHANGDRERAQVQARSSAHVIFTSTLGHEHGVPAKVVSDLFRLSNVFIFPSISENCSLVLLEAMLSGCLLVLNKDCSGLQEFGGDGALYFKMGNLDVGTRNEEVALRTESYLRDIALIIRSELAASRPLKAKRRAMAIHSLEKMMDSMQALYFQND